MGLVLLADFRKGARINRTGIPVYSAKVRPEPAGIAFAALISFGPSLGGPGPGKRALADDLGFEFRERAEDLPAWS